MTTNDLGSRFISRPTYLIFSDELLQGMKVSPRNELETHGWVITIMATDILVLKNQAINIHSASFVSIVPPKSHTKILHLPRTKHEKLK